jgi:hypothetical protein
MNTKVLSAGTRTVRRHPGKALRLSLFAIKRRRAILMVIDTTRRAAHVGATVKQAASNPRVQTETSSAISSLARASRRAQRVGVAKAPNDKQVAAQLRRAGRHASKAMEAATHPRRRHPVLRTTTIVTGAGALGGAAYAGWKAYDRSSPSTLTVNSASPAAPSTTDDSAQS